MLPSRPSSTDSESNNDSSFSVETISEKDFSAVPLFKSPVKSNIFDIMQSWVKFTTRLIQENPSLKSNRKLKDCLSVCTYIAEQLCKDRENSYRCFLIYAHNEIQGIAICRYERLLITNPVPFFSLRRSLHACVLVTAPWNIVDSIHAGVGTALLACIVNYAKCINAGDVSLQPLLVKDSTVDQFYKKRMFVPANWNEKYMTLEKTQFDIFLQQYKVPVCHPDETLRNLGMLVIKLA